MDIPEEALSETHLRTRLKEFALDAVSLLNILCTQLLPEASEGCWVSSETSFGRGDGNPDDMACCLNEDAPQ